MRAHICKWQGCNKLIDEISLYCDRHEPVVEAKRKKNRNELAMMFRAKTGPSVYNSPRWKNLRRRKLAQEPLCERCAQIATLVHHKDRDTSNWRMENMESLCSRCHIDEHRHGRKPKGVNKNPYL